MSQYNKIVPELKARWLTALRSGEYKQTRAALQDINGCNCCLGVLARIEGVPTKDKKWKEVDPAFYPYEDNYYGTFFVFDGENEKDGFPPDDWRGLTPAMQSVVANMNDEGKSFAEIADFIEANF